MEYSGASITWFFKLGNPPETFEWFFQRSINGNYENLNDESYKENNLNIRRMTHAMAGSYRCSATNRVGKTSVQIDVHVICKL